MQQDDEKKNIQSDAGQQERPFTKPGDEGKPVRIHPKDRQKQRQARSHSSCSSAV